MQDSEGHKWDFTLKGQLSVSDSRLVLTTFALDLASPDAPVTPSIAESWLASRLTSRIRDATREYSVEELRDLDALPVSWWEKQLGGWLADFGVKIQLEGVSWSSAEADAAEADAARERDFKRVAEARRKEHDAELREVEAAAEYETRKKQIEADLDLSEQERMHQLLVLEKRHRRELLEADTEIENACREAEKAALEHEVTLAQLSQDAERMQNAEELEDLAQERHRALEQEFEGLNKTLTKLADLPEALLAQLADRDARKANAAAERIVSPEFSIPAYELAGLGFRVDRQNLIEGLRERAAHDGDVVSILKRELVTRDIGTAKVNALPVNTPLQFEFSTERGGYVTLLNVGTSGSVYLHVPNAYVSVEGTRAKGEHTYQVPGPEFLPWEQLRQRGLDYVEVGPPGWEHLAVIISDESLVAGNVLEAATAQNPFVRLRTRDISEMCHALSEAPTGSWSAGVLSFLVG